MAASPYTPAPFHTAPNAALLIDFDNVTMGIRSDLGHELRSLLGSSIIKGKVAVQRAYADWRRYPQYVVPLAESSIDMIMAPAYGSSKKNATDIRLAIDAMELVFNRPEIGTYILLSGDSDFSSLVMKLKEYGKYVIGVGIRESSSDLLVQNCDEYYSYNALAGLVKTNEEENVKRDPWELVVEAATRMKRNGDVMRSDRLKQVMQEIDSTFDEKDLGMAKFSRFAQEAAQRGLIRVTKLENGQMEVDVAGDGKAVATGAASTPEATPRPRLERDGETAEESAARRSRRGRGGRGRGRDREPRAEGATPSATPTDGTLHFAPSLEEPVSAPVAPRAPAARTAEPEMVGERLTRDEALSLLKRSVAELTTSEDHPVPASAVRRKARELLGRDSETLDERFFLRILRDAHDADVIDLRKRGDDFEVAPAAAVASVADQLAAAVPPVAEPSQSARSAANAASLRRGMRGRGRGGEMPPELMNLGVVGSSAPTESVAQSLGPALVLDAEVEAEPAVKATAAKRGRASAAKRPRAKKTAAASATQGAPKAKRPRAKKTATEA
ncbi:MAG TPA: NYN domain-containing protein [Gemmatimonadaceae bacterium]|nr:NYN domain-containing protein [Gemmatimonadaceae bacterium]